MSFSIQSLYSWYRNTLRNPKYRWWMILGTAIYLISPIDIAPDFLPIIGQLDDIAVLTLFISEISQLLTERIQTRQRREPGSTSSDSVETPAAEIPVDVKAVSID